MILSCPKKWLLQKDAKELSRLWHTRTLAEIHTSLRGAAQLGKALSQWDDSPIGKRWVA
jgi:hypothetical protein